MISSMFWLSSSSSFSSSTPLSGFNYGTKIIVRQWQQQRLQLPQRLPIKKRKNYQAFVKIATSDASITCQGSCMHHDRRNPRSIVTFATLQKNGWLLPLTTIRRCVLPTTFTTCMMMHTTAKDGYDGNIFNNRNGENDNNSNIKRNDDDDETNSVGGLEKVGEAFVSICNDKDNISCRTSDTNNIINYTKRYLSPAAGEALIAAGRFWTSDWEETTLALADASEVFVDASIAMKKQATVAAVNDGEEDEQYLLLQVVADLFNRFGQELRDTSNIGGCTSIGPLSSIPNLQAIRDILLDLSSYQQQYNNNINSDNSNENEICSSSSKIFLEASKEIDTLINSIMD